MHSSRMHTGRSLTVCWRLLPRGGVCSRGVPGLGGCLVRGGAWSGGVPGLGGVSAPGGGGRSGIPACTEAAPPVDRITDA